METSVNFNIDQELFGEHPNLDAQSLNYLSSSAPPLESGYDFELHVSPSFEEDVFASFVDFDPATNVLDMPAITDLNNNATLGVPDAHFEDCITLQDLVDYNANEAAAHETAVFAQTVMAGPSVTVGQYPFDSLYGRDTLADPAPRDGGVAASQSFAESEYGTLNLSEQYINAGFTGFIPYNDTAPFTPPTSQVTYPGYAPAWQSPEVTPEAASPAQDAMSNVRSCGTPAAITQPATPKKRGRGTTVTSTGSPAKRGRGDTAINTGSPAKRVRGTTLASTGSPAKRARFSPKISITTRMPNMLQHPGPIAQLFGTATRPEERFALQQAVLQHDSPNKASGNDGSEVRCVQDCYKLQFHELTTQEKANLLLPLLRNEQPEEAERRKLQADGYSAAVRQREALATAQHREQMQT